VPPSSVRWRQEMLMVLFAWAMVALMCVVSRGDKAVLLGAHSPHGISPSYPNQQDASAAGGALDALTTHNTMTVPSLAWSSQRLFKDSFVELPAAVDFSYVTSLIDALLQRHAHEALVSNTGRKPPVVVLFVQPELGTPSFVQQLSGGQSAFVSLKGLVASSACALSVPYTLPPARRVSDLLAHYKQHAYYLTSDPDSAPSGYEVESIGQDPELLLAAEPKLIIVDLKGIKQPGSFVSEFSSRVSELTHKNYVGILTAQAPEHGAVSGFVQSRALQEDRQNARLIEAPDRGASNATAAKAAATNLPGVSGQQAAADQPAFRIHPMGLSALLMSAMFVFTLLAALTCMMSVDVPTVYEDKCLSIAKEY